MFYSDGLIQFKRIVKLLFQLKHFTQYLNLSKGFGDGVSKVAILHGMAEYQIEDLKDYIFHKNFSTHFPVESLRSKKIFLIESQEFKMTKNKEYVVLICPNPVLLLIIMRFKVHRLRHFSYKILSDIFLLNFNLQKLYGELVLKTLNELNELDIYTTISSLNSYPIEFYFHKESRNFFTNVIHYGQNIFEMKYKDESKAVLKNAIINNKSLGDIHWVWTENYAQYLRKINSNIIFKAVGSITFKVNEKKESEVKKNAITLFDVAPHEVYKNKDFYNNELAIKFIEDIIYLRDTIKELNGFEVRLKPKRLIQPAIHSPEYISFIKELEAENAIVIVPWNCNPYTLISSSKLTITIPFSTIAYVGLEVGTKTIFYHPYKRELIDVINKGEIPVIHGIDALKSFLIEFTTIET
jgi:polysaccharide biosynthesis PFTS motif protein